MVIMIVHSFVAVVRIPQILTALILKFNCISAVASVMMSEWRRGHKNPSCDSLRRGRALHVMNRPVVAQQHKSFFNTTLGHLEYPLGAPCGRLVYGVPKPPNRFCLTAE